MINAAFKLVSPRKIETFFSDVSLQEGTVLVRPDMLSICKADIRYFFGMRDAKVLKQKLPLALIHEGVGTVLYDPQGELKTGETVVMLPNIPGSGDRADENYRLDSKFRSSGADGFMQEIMALPRTQVIPYKNVPKEIAAFTEFISVGVHAVTTYLDRKKNSPRRIGIWGDGSLGYVVGSLIKYYLPDVEMAVIGVQRTKLELFHFADEIYTIDEIEKGKIWFDDTFECVGGQASGSAISQMIDVIEPEGTMMLLGVSENEVGVNTRMVLEKGLTMIGRSRSRREDFEEAVRILMSGEGFVRRMKVMVSGVVDIHKIDDINRAFDISRAVDFKVMLNWKL